MAVSSLQAPTITLKRFNDIVSIAIVLLACYIFLLPILPQLGWWWRHSAPLVSTPVQHGLVASPTVVPADNRLDIPAMGLNQHIYEGQSVYTVNKGVWLRPTGSTPDKGSNTVMVGHRFTYSGPQGVFYFLDKLKLGDTIIVNWQSKAYTYRVSNISVVPPTDTAVEAPTTDKRLTLYTCTPLWTSKERLVVTAGLDNRS